MAEPERSKEVSISSFSKSGIYRLESNNSSNHIIYFIDPVRILNRSYSCFQISPFKYYSRFFKPKEQGQTRASGNLDKKNRKKRKFHRLNERELVADQRHQEARPLLLKAHEALLRDKEILSVLCNLPGDECSLSATKDLYKDGPCFIQLGSVWQAPMYEISLNFRRGNNCTDDGGSGLVQFGEQEVVLLFNNLVINDTSDDVEATTLDNCYIIPRESCFHMSNLEQLHALVPGTPHCLTDTFCLFLLANSFIHKEPLWPCGLPIEKNCGVLLRMNYSQCGV